MARSTIGNDKRGKTLAGLCLGWLLIWSMIDQCRAGAWPDARIGAGLGVQVKPERTHDDDLSRIRSSGFSYLRFDMRWADVEQQREHYDWRFFDDFIAKLRAHDLNAIVILNGGNPIYSGMVAMPPEKAFGLNALAAAPRDDTAVKAFAAFGAAAAERYGTRDIIWEIWNEPDTVPFWPPRPDADTFAKLATETCAAIRRVRSEATVVAPGLAGLPGKSRSATNLLGTLLRSPVSSCLNAVSIHLHRLTEMPESVLIDYADVIRPFIIGHTPRVQQPLRVISGEWGYTTTKATEDQQASYLIRSHLINLLSGVPLSIWYEWRDSGTAAHDDEAHFGLIDDSGRIKTAAALSLLSEIKDATLETRLPSGNASCFVLQLRQPDGRHQLLAWLSAERILGSTVLQIDGATPESHKLTGFPQLFDYGPGSRIRCD
jgi:hypothetical protein